MVDIINKNDLASIEGEISSTGLQRKKNRVEVMIHTMPKRFLQLPDQSSNKNKNIGLYIVLGGSFVLIVVLGLLYYYLSRPTTTVSLINENRHVATDNNSTTTVKEQLIEEANINKQASSTNKNISGNNGNEIKEVIDENSLPKEKIKENNVVINNEEIKTVETTSTAKIIATEPEIVNDVILKAALDTDSDGLSDIEELVLDCNPQVKDSDGDGYNDLDELVKLYNPAGGGKIIVNPNIEKYTNFEFNYSVYYPKNWIINNALGNNSVVFQLGGDEFIQIMIEPKFEQNSLDDWYKDQFGVKFIQASQRLFKVAWVGIKNKDNLIVYLYNPNYDYLVILSYSPGSDIIKYQNIFEMMISSFDFIN